MEEKFRAAVDVIKSIPYDGTFEPSDEMMLKLHAYEKQATEGPCNIPKPYIWNVSSRAKWNAWHELGDMPKEVAMQGYIEELSKVIETMSYNEKISKFISLMGPFYEVISSEENHSQKEKKIRSEKSIPDTILENYQPPTMSEIYHMSKITDEKKDSQLESRIVQMCDNFQYPGRASKYSRSSSSSSSDISNFDVLSDLSDMETSAVTEQNAVDNRNNNLRSCHFLTKKDILVLTIINLRNAMEDVLQKFDNLHTLAESVDLGSEMTACDTLHYDDWNLNLTGTAFAFLWPIIVELYIGSFRK